MLKTWTTPCSHEEAFIQRHEWLLGWALQMTGRNQAQAEDLVHDTFIHFVLSRPDLDAIKNLEGYLYTMLKNMHLSQVRRLARAESRRLSMVDYDSVAVGLSAVTPLTRLQAQDELRAVCLYACVRKEKSKAGSVLILRFFHGYYPGEIARILGSPRRAVDDWLRMARREARMYIETPDRLAFQKKKAALKIAGPSHAQDIVSELRQTIFRACHHDCLSPDQLHELYRSPEPASLGCAELAHVVSCSACLDRINGLLGLPCLADRHPTDRSGKDGPSRPANGGPSRNGRGADAATPESASPRIQVQDVFEHHPAELCVSVNGFIVGSQSLGSEVNEQTLNINVSEKIGFVEVFSEQELRLLFLTVEAPPDGPVEQPAVIELSEGRRLELTVSFQAPWPQVRVVYFDPTVSALLEAAPQAEATSPVDSPADARQAVSDGPAKPRLHAPTIRWAAALRSWLTPRTVTALLAILLLAALLFIPRRGPAASAAELLRRASRSEETAAPPAGTVLHRTLKFDARRISDATLITSRRIETWVGATKTSKVRRVYDDKEQVIAAEWAQKDGTRLIYDRAAARRFERADQPANVSLAAEQIWQVELSAKTFASLVAGGASATVSEGAGVYRINYQCPPTDTIRQLRAATLTLNKADLRALEQRLVVRQNGQDVEYHFVEVGFERVAADRVTPAVFEVDPELRSAAPPAMRETISATNDTAPAATAAPEPLSAARLAELQADGLYRLHQVGSCVRERAAFSRSADGGLRITAVVETEKRKAELLDALTPLTKSAAVTLEINTVAEAGRSQQALPSLPVAVRRVEIVKDQMPAYADLRRYFDQSSRNSSADQKPSGGAVDEAARRFANRMLSLSRQALVEAWALKHHREEMAAMNLGLLSPQSQARWHLVMSEHAMSVRQAVGRLHMELQPIFAPQAAGDLAGGDDAPADLDQAIESLLQMVATAEQAVRGAFAASNDNAVTVAIKTEAFWYALQRAERLARAVSRAGD
ncbi:MAG TPA: sigma-70 family RNA polymerase sigma factor [Blastocatellia bacterium]|nr:sigma-70 family RNA polymerase sigma factor [Blastocatellia bacterium]